MVQLLAFNILASYYWVLYGIDTYLDFQDGSVALVPDVFQKVPVDQHFLSESHKGRYMLLRKASLPFEEVSQSTEYTNC